METEAMWGVASQVWVMVSAALVLLMTPGLAFFYGGLSRARSAINMMMMSFGAMGLVAVVWVLWGYSMSGGGTSIAGIVADPITAFGLQGLDLFAAATDDIADGIDPEDVLSDTFGLEPDYLFDAEFMTAVETGLARRG